MKKYGFITEQYATGSIETLQTGDGKSQFTDMHFSDGSVAIGMSYGRGTGINTKENYPANTLATDINVKWQIKFEDLGSINAMIETLERVKTGLTNATSARKPDSIADFLANDSVLNGTFRVLSETHSKRIVVSISKNSDTGTGVFVFTKHTDR